MNRLQYFTKSLAARFGVVAPRHYLRTATEESIQLKEAETIIGKMAWRDLEGVEELATEYWRIRQLDTEHDKLEEELRAVKTELDGMEDRGLTPDAELSAQLEAVRHRLETERDGLTEKLQALQDRIHRAELVRKRFNGLKLKLTVLKGENAPEETLAAIRNDLQGTKSTYSDLAREVENIRGDVRLLEDKVKGIQSEEDNVLGRINERERAHARLISSVSRRSIEITARLAIIEGEKNELFGTIGHILRSERDHESDAYKSVIRKFSPIIRRARDLCSSIELNRRMADFR